MQLLQNVEHTSGAFVATVQVPKGRDRGEGVIGTMLNNQGHLVKPSSLQLPTPLRFCPFYFADFCDRIKHKITLKIRRYSSLVIGDHVINKRAAGYGASSHTILRRRGVGPTVYQEFQIRIRGLNKNKNQSNIQSDPDEA